MSCCTWWVNRDFWRLLSTQESSGQSFKCNHCTSAETLLLSYRLPSTPESSRQSWMCFIQVSSFHKSIFAFSDVVNRDLLGETLFYQHYCVSRCHKDRIKPPCPQTIWIASQKLQEYRHRKLSILSLYRIKLHLFMMFCVPQVVSWAFGVGCGSWEHFSW